MFNILIKDESFMKKWNDDGMINVIRERSSHYKNLLCNPRLNNTLQDRTINYALINELEIPYFIKY